MKRLILITASIAATAGAFAQQQCVKTAVNLSGNQMNLTTSGAKSTTSRPAFIYYERKRHRKHDETYTIPGVAAQFPSEPVLLSTSQDVTPVPEKYNVSVTLPQNNMTACADSTMNLEGVLAVERVASYTGNYPANRVTPYYHKVSKRDYKMAVRKKRKIERKEAKIARRTEVNVEVKSPRV